MTKHPTFGQRRDKAEETTEAAKAIIQSELTARDKKSAKLKEARLARDAEAELSAAPTIVAKPRPKRKAPTVK